MPNVNKVILIGHVTRDPATKVLQSNTTVAEFGLAMSRKFKGAGGEDREEVCFVDCAAFGKTAELLGQYVKKGHPLFVEGRLKLDQWEDKNGGGKRSKLSVVIDNFQFLKGREQQGGDHDISTPPPSVKDWDGANLPERPARTKPTQPFGDNREFKEADIPF